MIELLVTTRKRLLHVLDELPQLMEALLYLPCVVMRF